jgi:hypothetical protein
MHETACCFGYSSYSSRAARQAGPGHGPLALARTTSSAIATPVDVSLRQRPRPARPGLRRASVGSAVGVRAGTMVLVDRHQRSLLGRGQRPRSPIARGCDGLGDAGPAQSVSRPGPHPVHDLLRLRAAERLTECARRSSQGPFKLGRPSQGSLSWASRRVGLGSRGLTPAHSRREHRGLC